MVGRNWGLRADIQPILTHTIFVPYDQLRPRAAYANTIYICELYLNDDMNVTSQHKHSVAITFESPLVDLSAPSRTQILVDDNASRDDRADAVP